MTSILSYKTPGKLQVLPASVIRDEVVMWKKELALTRRYRGPRAGDAPQSEGSRAALGNQCNRFTAVRKSQKNLPCICQIKSRVFIQ